MLSLIVLGLCFAALVMGAAIADFRHARQITPLRGIERGGWNLCARTYSDSKAALNLPQS